MINNWTVHLRAISINFSNTKNQSWNRDLMFGLKIKELSPVCKEVFYFQKKQCNAGYNPSSPLSHTSGIAIGSDDLLYHLQLETDSIFEEKTPKSSSFERRKSPIDKLQQSRCSFSPCKCRPPCSAWYISFAVDWNFFQATHTITHFKDIYYIIVEM